MEIEIRRIAAAATHAVRWPVLRPGLPPETTVFDGDDSPETRHLGAFRHGELIGVASIYPAVFPLAPERRNAWQLRGMAVMPKAQGKGSGLDLLVASVAEAQLAGGEWIWCNARAGAAPFYAKFGWQIVGGELEIPTVGLHFRMCRRL